jgi:hypothetical protein
MRNVRSTAILTAAATATALALPTAAHAAVISQAFAADSGDSCTYGSSSGTLGWQVGPSPLPGPGVAVSGKVADRPLPVDPGTICRNDGYNSTVTFVAYTHGVEVDRQSRTADNGTVTFSFMLGAAAGSKGVDTVVVQVCRNPVVTLPPSYCGKPVTYTSPAA